MGIAVAEPVMVRRVPAHRERHDLAGGDGELADRGHFGGAAKLDGGDELQRVGAGNGVRTAEMLAHPGNAAAVIEAHDQLGAHAHAASVASDQTDQIDLILALGQRHEIDQRDAAFFRLELGLENPGFTPVAP